MKTAQKNPKFLSRPFSMNNFVTISNSSPCQPPFPYPKWTHPRPISCSWATRYPVPHVYPTQAIPNLIACKKLLSCLFPIKPSIPKQFYLFIDPVQTVFTSFPKIFEVFVGIFGWVWPSRRQCRCVSEQLIAGQYLSRESARTRRRRDELNGETSGGSGENSPPNNWLFLFICSW